MNARSQRSVPSQLPFSGCGFQILGTWMGTGAILRAHRDPAMAVAAAARLFLRVSLLNDPSYSVAVSGSVCCS